MKNNRFVYVFLSVIVVLILASTAFVSLSTPMPELPCPDLQTKLPALGADVMIYSLNGKPMSSGHGQTSEEYPGIAMNIPQGWSYINVRTAYEMGWAINAESGQVTMKPVGYCGWYKVYAKFDAQYTDPKIWVFRVYN